VRTVLDKEFGAHDQIHGAFASGLMSTHNAGHRAFVGQRKRPIAEGIGARDQFAGAGGGAAKAERAQAMQFGIIRHARILY